MSLLHPGDLFPALTVKLINGEALHLPDAFAGHFGVVLFYRGSWCPFCNAQLRAYQRAIGNLTDVGARLVALSVDDEQTTRDLVDKHALQFPVGHSADPGEIAHAVGAFLNDDPVYVQSTGVVLDPAGRVLVSVYSSGAIGRLMPDDVVGFIRYVRENAAASDSQ
jgi:peroxiredoxin